MSTLKGDSHFVLELADRLAELTPGQRYLVADMVATLAHAVRARTVQPRSVLRVDPGAVTVLFPWQG